MSASLMQHSSSTSTPKSIMYSPPPKNYEAAFGTLQSQYGLGGFSTPTLPPKDAKQQKWYKWGESRSSSTASLMRPPRRSDSPIPSPSPQYVMPAQGTLSEPELRLGRLTAEYGYGPAPPARFNRH